MSTRRSIGLLLAVTLTASWPARADWREKVDPRLLDAAAFGAADRAEFLVLLSDRADLSPAASLRTKEEKGAYVVRALMHAAERSQPAVTGSLKAPATLVQSFWIDNMILVRGSFETVRALAERGDVRRIAANPVVRFDAPAVRRDESPRAPTAVEWNIARINATGVWALGFTGQGVVLGGQDTGYQWNHPALLASYRGAQGGVTNHAYHWHDAIHSGGGSCGPDSPFPCDDSGHGTHTMGTMTGDDGGANEIGVAPGALWIGCRNMNVGWGTPATYTECFEWFLAPTDGSNANPDPAKAPDVINNSWSCVASEGCTDPNLLSGVVAAVRSAGIVVVVAAGNSGSACGTVGDPPGIYEESFTVGNTDSTDTIAGGSSRGPVTSDGSNRRKPDVCAPGSAIRSSLPGGGYGSMTGTSMAAPHVAGVIALILSAHPGLRGHVDRIERLVERTARARTTAQTCGGIDGSIVPNNTYGWGIVDAFKAVGLSDGDGDGMPDWWEVVHALDPGDSSDGSEDADGDLQSNRAEYGANTDPASSNSVLRLQTAAWIGSNEVHLAWTSRQDGFDSARTYALQWSTNLLDPDAAWHDMEAGIASAGDLTQRTNVVPAGLEPPAYFRVVAAGPSPAAVSRRLDARADAR